MQGSMVMVWFPVCVNEFRFIYCALIPAELTTSAIISTTTPHPTPQHHPLPLPFQHLKPPHCASQTLCGLYSGCITNACSF